MPQSLSKVYIHIVFSTKHGHRFIDKDVRPELQSYIVRIISELGSYVHEIYANPDHIHILCTLPRTITIAELVNKIKSNSSHWSKTRNEYFRWQDGYGVFSVSQTALNSVSRYIKNQPKHHDTISFKDEMRKMYKDYEIDYDEMYVWD